MPELPEVEVVRAGLERHVVGARVVAVDVLHERPVRRDPRGPEGFALALAGRTITGASRRGKYLWLPLDDGDALRWLLPVPWLVAGAAGLLATTLGAARRRGAGR